MKKFFSCVLLLVSSAAFAGTPSEDKVTAKYQQLFKASAGSVWDMEADDNVYFTCNLHNTRKGGVGRYTFTFKITNDGGLSIINTILVNGRFAGVPLLPETKEVVGHRGSGDSSDPLELIALRVGAPISMEKPMIDSWENNGLPQRIMSRPLYVEVSQIQEGVSVKYVTKPISPSAKSDSRYRAIEYGVCFLSKENSRLNNSGRGFGGNTRSAWDGASVWGGRPYVGGGY